MSSRAGGLSVGLVFGIVLSWSGMTSPEVIRQALLFERSYLFLFFASAVLVAAVGQVLVRRVQTHALLSRVPINWNTEAPERRHIAGSLLFGLGWGITDACPGPIATQVGQGIGWGVCTLAGVVIGVYLFLRVTEAETEPATELPSSADLVPNPQGVS